MGKPLCLLLVGPPGSGKSTLATSLMSKGYTRINQDDQGREGHMDLFNKTLLEGKNIVIDRLNFNEQQRNKYIIPAEAAGYDIQIKLLVISREHAKARCMARQGHPTIKDETNANNALDTFFLGFTYPERPYEKILIKHPDYREVDVIVSDLDGSLCDTSHRQHFMEGSKKNWKGFFDAIPNDDVAEQVYHTLEAFKLRFPGMPLILCSARPDSFRKVTEDWLKENTPMLNYEHLFMRHRQDMRKDSHIKEMLLDFEINTRYSGIYLVLDDRDVVVRMWRRRGITTFQVAPGDF